MITAGMTYLLFSSFTILKKFILKICVQDFLRIFSFHLGKYPGVEPLGHMEIVCLTLLKIAKHVQSGGTFYVPTRSSPMLDMASAMNFSCSRRCVMVFVFFWQLLMLHIWTLSLNILCWWTFIHGPPNIKMWRILSFSNTSYPREY